MSAPTTGARAAASSLKELAAAPGLLSLLGWSLVGRLHLSATLVALLIVAADITGSYATAGLVSGALVLGQGLTAPLRGRTVDRRPAARLLVWTSVLYGAGVAALAAVPERAGWQLLAGAAFLVGLACPPSTQVSRAKVAQLAHGPLRQRAFTLQATVNELVLVAGPGAASLAIAGAGARGAVAVCGALALVGGFGLAAAVRRAGVDAPAVARGTDEEVTGRSLLRDPAVVRCVAAVTALIAGFAIIDFVLVTWSHQRGSPALGGVLTGVWAAGSAAGGLTATLWCHGAANLRRRLLLVAAGVALLLPALAVPLTGACGSPWAVVLALALGGTVIPPALAALYDHVADSAGPGRRGEVFGWIATATTAASAAANPLAGAALDRWGPLAPVAVALAACCLATVLVTGAGKGPASS
ncbi:MFS transporter [Streptomyces sp. ISL-36]|uniref:MFS transporter n=1 Tax=Streptomyces sp. ISL-36 TaxID=2819182 RepID=UPI001BE6A17D|nr:MFS transporter [Streptomyces sp. ISL-36]MBT2439463.1 MFS transporter [Streptomyces sp. ISL-36]